MSIVMENANCFDFLPTLENNSVDLVLIDPPYEILEKSWYKDRFHAGDEKWKNKKQKVMDVFATTMTLNKVPSA